MGDSRFLFIHYHYPPIKNSGVYRNYYLSTAITDKSGESFLITTNNRKILPNEPLLLHPKMKRYEAFTFDYRKVVSMFTSKKSRSGAQFSEKVKESFLAGWLIKMQRSFPFNILFAEGSIIYIIHGYFKAKNLIKTKGVNVVFSSFMPYADHMIAWLLKRRFPQLVWIADFRDLQVEPIYKNVLWPKFQNKVEKFILSKADVVTTVSDGISKKMRGIHHNVHTITKGVEIRESKDSFDKFTIHYSGSLFQNFRDPRPLFHALADLIEEQRIDKDKISMIYAGKDGALMTQWATESNIVDVFINKGMLTRADAMDIQDKSHINLLLTSASEEHTGLLTGKLFEYIEAGREILCLIKGSKDIEIETMFEKYHLGSVMYNEIQVKKYILDKYNEFIRTGGVNSSQKRDEIIRDMSWQRQADRVLDVALLNNRGN